MEQNIRHSIIATTDRIKVAKIGLTVLKPILENIEVNDVTSDPQKAYKIHILAASHKMISRYTQRLLLVQLR